MKFTYPAVITKKEDGTYHGYCPDLATCEADGETVQETADNLTEAAKDWIELELADEFCDLPPITDMDDLAGRIGPDDVLRNVCVTIRLFVGYDE